MKKVEVAGRMIGSGHPCFVIAEAGSNHDRDYKQALRLIDVAAQAGADAVKFQVFKAEKLYSVKTPMMGYLRKNKLVKQGERVFDLLKRLEMPRHWIDGLSKYCRKHKILFLATPFDEEAVDELERIDMPAYKIASFEITHLPLLERVAGTGKPIILSTGMADLDDIKTALATIRKAGGKNVALLQCAINYPARFEDLHLRAMDTMRDTFGLPVGFSDHTLGITADIAAAARGACIVEKHYTLSRKLSGPDHSFALEPDELKAMVEGIRQAEASLGSPIKKHAKSEEEMYRLGRRSLVAARDIPNGAVVKRDMIDVKRPGYGIPTKMMGALIGRVARCDIEADEILKWKMFR